MTVKKNFFIPLCLLLLMCADSYSQCSNLSFMEGVKRNLISDDLFVTAIDSAGFACPQYTQGDSTLCGTVSHAGGVSDAPLPDGILFSLFYFAPQYRFCKDIFSDPAFIAAVTAMPEPTKEEIKWFDWRKTFHTTLLDDEADPLLFSDLDLVQRKMIPVFKNIKSWTFCSERMYSGDKITHGTFNRNTNDVVIYSTACKAASVYEANISTTALAFRMFFVCSHELGHMMDKMNGSLGRESVAVAELRANVNGLIITQAFARLVVAMFKSLQSGVEQSPEKLPCDTYFIKKVIDRWQDVAGFFERQVSDAKKRLNNAKTPKTAAINKANWMIWACMEDPQSYHTE